MHSLSLRCGRLVGGKTGCEDMSEQQGIVGARLTWLECRSHAVVALGPPRAVDRNTCVRHCCARADAVCGIHRMSSTLSAPSIDDLVDMFPQYPRSTVVDVLQRVGAAQAVETLLTFADEVSVRSSLLRCSLP